MRLGLDLHGVIDDDPEFFAGLAEALRDSGNEIYIVTGREEGEALHNDLKECRMEGVHTKLYDSILSITTYQKDQGVPVSYLDGRKSQPMMDPAVWNPTKAMLCASMGIHIMIDDSTLYEPFFRDIKTQYIIYTPEIKSFLRDMFYFGGTKL